MTSAIQTSGAFGARGRGIQWGLASDRGAEKVYNPVLSVRFFLFTHQSYNSSSLDSLLLPTNLHLKPPPFFFQPTTLTQTFYPQWLAVLFLPTLAALKVS
jgi:hypothetical protein